MYQQYTSFLLPRNPKYYPMGNYFVGSIWFRYMFYEFIIYWLPLNTSRNSRFRLMTYVNLSVYFTIIKRYKLHQSLPADVWHKFYAMLLNKSFYSISKLRFIFFFLLDWFSPQVLLTFSVNCLSTYYSCGHSVPFK